MKVFKKAMALLLAFAMIVQPLSVSAATNTESKPSDGTTNEPFAKGTAGSNSFRIPSLVTLSDGTLVAAADARWNTTYDGGGLDTIVSRSSDNGANWSYTFANYLGDNGNVYNGSSSTCFIDPAMAVTSDDTIYMLVDLYPYGVALNGDGTQTNPSTEVGFDGEGRLLLSDNNHSSYGYYLDNGKIYSTSGEEVSGYTVDEHFNITGNGTDSNLFFKDSPFQVVRTGYLYLTKSTDNGATWSAPTLLNLKTSSEQVCLVGPGRGLVTSSDMIVFPVYSYNSYQKTQKMSFVYSTDGGIKWDRSNSFTGADWSSESAVVELTDGTLRFFYRNGTSHLCYADYNVENSSWGTATQTDIATNSNCQISAITYSKTVDGKQVILVSCPTGANEAGSDNSSASARLNGKIFVGLVDDQNNNTMTWMDNPISVTKNENQFMYSCLTELKDGSIAILYENYESKWGTGTDCYYTMDFKTYNPSELGLTVDSSDLDNENSSNGDINDAVTNEPTTTSTENVTLEIGESQTFVDETGNYESNESNIYGDTTIAKVDVKGETVAGGTVETQEQSLVSGTAYYIKNSDNQYLTAAATWTADLPDAVKWTYTEKEESYGYYSYKKYLLSNGNNYLVCNNDELTVDTTESNATSWKVSKGNFKYTYGMPWDNTTFSLGQAYSITTTEPVNTTTISITGIKPGTTTAIVGDTTYNITVNKKQVSATISAGNSATFADASAKILSNTNSKAATATVSNGTLTVNAIAEGTTIITTEYAVYTITVNEGTLISIKENETKELSVTLEDGQYVEWSTADSSYVGVAGKYDATVNAYTNAGVIMGHNVTESPVVVTATIYNVDGTVAGVQKWLVTVTEGDADTNNKSRYIYVDVTAIEHCTVYYSVNGGELVELKETGVLVDEQITGHYNIMFFAAPDEGYALTYMNVTGSGKQYYTLSNGNPDGTGSEAWPFKSESASTIPTSDTDSAWKSGHGFRWALLQENMTIEQMKLLFTNALELGCDGATTFTKNDTTNFYTEVQFAAQKLPMLEKEIVSVRDKDGNTTTYTENMKVSVGDTINYKITITEYAEQTGDIWTGNSYTITSPITSSNKPIYSTGSYGTITYSEEYLTDELTYDNWDVNLDKSSATDDIHTFDTSLTLLTNNFSKVVEDGKITNTADFKYTYSSEYSNGTLDATASAVAEITVDVPSYVIDFGLPVTFDISNLDVSVGGNLKDATAKYGNAVIIDEDNNTKIQYTPNAVLLETDYIKLTYNNGATYAIAIYPATTVYYEEYFAKGVSGAWKSFSATTNLTQEAEKVGESKLYGYDAAYDSDGGAVGASNGTEAVSTEASVATFTFTGTGVDIYTNNTKSSGVLMAWVKNAVGNTVKFIQVDTHTANGYSSYTSGQAVDAYNVPVVSLTGLERDTYTVELRHIGQSVDGKVVYNQVSLDGFRVHGTIDYATDAYVTDKENNPTFVELRDRVLAGLNVDKTNSIYAKDIAADTLAQVYATADSTNGAVVLSSYDVENTSDNIQDLLDNGPKNELYLRPGELVVFKVTTNNAVQIGLKALNEKVSYSINNGTTVELTTSTDMFYSLAEKTDRATEVTYTITNNSNSDNAILSITELKLCGAETTATQEVEFEALTEEDLMPALLSLGFESEATYADASLAISVNDADGNVLASTALTANGVVGETATFTEATIQAAVEALELPENYKLENVEYADVEVAYGESDSISFTATEEVVEPEEPDDSASGNTGSFIDKIFDAIKNFFNGLWK